MSVVLRPARSTDAGSTGGILHHFAREHDWMPELHSLAQTIAFCGTMIDRGWVEVAEVDGQVEGFIARNGPEILSLYLSPCTRGQGIGRQLLGRAKTQCARLELRAFEANAGAQRFYLREGFAETKRSTGSDNDEKLPDITYVWRKESDGDDPRPDTD
ncbi:MAG: GNAT family N-acetyltransferase [Marinibacterium sp.]|nr:GNAT family N-acetyltransferase [Marinibacterium sp.]